MTFKATINYEINCDIPTLKCLMEIHPVYWFSTHLNNPSGGCDKSKKEETRSRSASFPILESEMSQR